MQPQEITFNIKLTSEMVNAIAHKVAEIQDNNEGLVDLISKKIANEQEIYSVKEVAKMLDKDPKTILKHCKIGLLKAHKVGKSYVITQINLKNYLNAQ